jgi:hypothetical protein
MPTFNGFFKQPNSPTVYGILPGGQRVAFETPEQFFASGGARDWSNVQTDPTFNPAGAINYSQYQQQSTPAPAAPAQTQTPAPAQTTSVTGNTQLDEILTRMDKMIQDQAAAGNQFNPNIEITPDIAQKFLDQATGEVEPYYSGQINAIKGDLSRSLTGLQKQYDLNKRDAEAQFKSDLSAKRESLAGAGLAQSGFRGQQEQQLAQGTNRTMEGLGLNVENQAGNLLSSANKTIGSGNLLDLNMPVLSQYQANTAGAGGLTVGNSLDFGTPTNLTGSLQYSQSGDIRSLSDYLKQQEVQRKTLNF